jgi:hypothetical protein
MGLGESLPNVFSKFIQAGNSPVYLLTFSQQTYQKEKQSLSFCPPGIVGLINLTLLALKL